MALQMISKFGNRLPFLQSGTIMRICLVVSFVIHILFVLTFRQAFPWAWPEEELRTYTVEFIRPPVDDLEQDDLSDGEMGRNEKNESPDHAQSQDTISLDTLDKRYVSYTRVIKTSIMREWTYPPLAKENLIEGKLLLMFSLKKTGEMVGIRILTGSGHRILDDEAVRAVRAASPFPPFPDHITVGRLNIKADIDYRITARH